LTVAVVFAFWIALSYLTLADRPRAHRFLVAATEPVRKVALGALKPRMSRQGTYTEKDLSEFHWTNGLPPTEDESPEWLAHRDNDWDSWRLTVRDNLGDRWVEMTLDELRALPKAEYVA